MGKNASGYIRIACVAQLAALIYDVETSLSLTTSKGNAYCFLYTNQQKHNIINKQTKGFGSRARCLEDGDVSKDSRQDYPGCLQHKKEETKLTRANTVYLLVPRVYVHLNLLTLTVFQFVKYIIIV